MTSWLVDTFQMEPGWARGIGFFIAVVIVLALISIFVWVLRRIAGTRALGGRSRQPRVAVMDAAALDTRRRLILIRRDNVEHLLLVGGPSDVVVERNIVRGVPVSQAYPRQPAAASETTVTMAPLDTEPQPVPVAPAQPAMREAAPPRPAPQQAPAARRPAPQPAPAPQANAAPPAPRAPAPQRSFAPSQPRPADNPDNGASPLKRAGASVAAAGAAVAGLARGGSTAAAAERTDASAPAPRAPTPSASSAFSSTGSVSAPPPRRDPPPPIRRNVTPPSSGPAANARTAFPQFGENGDKTSRGDLSGVSAAAGTGAGAASGVSSPASAPTPVAPLATSPAATPSSSSPAAPSSAPPAAEKRAPEPGSLEDALLAELDQSRGGAPAPRSEPRADFGARPTPPSAPAPAPQAAPSVEPPRAEPVAGNAPEPGEDGAGTPEPVKADAPATPVEETPADNETSAEAAPAETQAPHSDQPEKAEDDASAPGKAADGSPVTMDAIEEEMARLLSEISGTRK